MQAIMDTVSFAPRGPHDPESHPEARTTGHPPARQRCGNSTENARAGAQGAAEGDSGEGPDLRSGEQMAVVAAEEATVPAAHLAVHALPATPPAPTGTTHRRAANHSGTELLTYYETPGTENVL